jgi:putative RNA 2'-phosphotransferase
MSENSKLLSYLLRHKPEQAHLILDGEGWVEIDTLLPNIQKYMGVTITRTQLDEIVETNDKKRFTVRDNKIRAAQGHSVDVSIRMEQKIPPTVLYHGTKGQFVASIMKQGLMKGNRNHVHLSADRATAIAVADRRKGISEILTIDTREMVDKERKFFLSENGVWLTDYVPPKYIKI